MRKQNDRAPKGRRPGKAERPSQEGRSHDRPKGSRGGPRKPGGEDRREEGGRERRASDRPGAERGRPSAGRPAAGGRPERRGPADGPRKTWREDRREEGERGGPGRRTSDRAASGDRPTRRSAGAGPRPFAERNGPKPRPEKPWKRQSRDERTFKEGDPLTRRPFRKGERSNRFSLPNPANDGTIRLNKYLAQAGVGSRREADELITTGVVTVNGKVVTELGTKIQATDIVHFGGQKLSTEQKRYVLLNKPKDTITTTDDPSERHTVMDLIAKACTERLYPVGRLDRNTTGVLLLTNDGDLAKKLTHPSHGAEKLYHVTLDKTVQPSHLRELVDGLHLEDGLAQADEASYVSSADSRREVGVKLHMGRNRIVRRMFEHLGYEVVKLDRVMFAGLTKKDLQRGHWRHLSDKELTLLKRLQAPPKEEKSARGGRRLRSFHGDE